MRRPHLALRWTTSFVASVLIATFLVLGGPPAAVTNAAGTTTLCSGYSACRTAGYSDAGYGAVNNRMYWNMYSGHNCTNYVAYRMIQAGMSTARPWTGGGNASEWGKHMASITDQVPNVGAVAWWGKYSNGSGSAGHVAYVEQVLSATTIVVSEDSWGGTFHWRIIEKSSGRWPTGFIHFVDKTIAGQAGPVISGTPQVGVTLTASAGIWSVEPTHLGYQWFGNGVAIPGATEASYTPTGDRQGMALYVRTTAWRPGYTGASQWSAITPLVLEGVITPQTPVAIGGDLVLDHVLTGDPGTYLPAPSTTAWRWFADGVRIPDNITPQLALTADLVGKEISVRVVAKQDGYAKYVSPTQALGPVLAGVIAMATPPAMTGAPELGQLLTVTPGTATPADATPAYRWLRDGIPIAGANAPTYQISAADVGASIAAEVVLTRPQYLPYATTLPGTTPVTSPATIKLVTKGRKGKAIVRVKVRAAGMAAINKKVRIKIGSWKTKVRLSDGKAKVKVDLPRGRKTVTAKFLGTSVVPPATATGKVRVR